MRREVARPLLGIGLALLAGGLAGRFAVPYLEPRTIHHVSVFPQPGEDRCGMGIIDVTSVLGWESRYSEQYSSLPCAQSRTFGTTIVDCRCPRAAADEEGKQDGP